MTAMTTTIAATDRSSFLENVIRLHIQAGSGAESLRNVGTAQVNLEQGETKLG
jgi:hypothetical protein